MGRIRLKYDLANGPHRMGLVGDGLPSNTAPTAKLLNIGSATYPVLSSTSGKTLEVYGKFTHTSGDARAAYIHLDLSGSVGGEAVRALTTVNANVDTARGAHISLDFVATAGGSECSGLGVAMDACLMIPNVASWAPTGTYAAIQAEIYSWGANSDPAGMTELSFIRINSGGDATGRADVDTDAFLFSLQGFTSAADTTKLISTVSLAELSANSIALRIKVGSATYWLLAVPTSELN